ncbi:unnamed protein product [Effrenium voratum]|uniref:Uncharacterized protein n=1 Tax=Effrenium voratum TaxID=2562239 RepID=A0AA36MJ27_9DINO|nr:unnamed protein product [Effrenium voratum]
MLPELIYFLTELALASEDVLAGGSVYEGSGGTRKSNLFLAKITRPIYNVVFEAGKSAEMASSGGKTLVHFRVRLLECQ